MNPSTPCTPEEIAAGTTAVEAAARKVYAGVLPLAGIAYLWMLVWNIFSNVAAGAVTEVVAWSRTQEKLERARSLGIIDRALSSAAEAARGAALVVLATPVGSLAALAAEIAPVLEPGALVIDVGQATDIPVTNKKRFGDVRLGKGPILSRGSVNHPVLVRRLEDVANKHKIAFQRGIDPRYSGTDADAIFLQRGGIATAAVGVPNRYMHTPVEAVHLGDLEKLAEWLCHFILDLSPQESFKVKV